MSGAQNENVRNKSSQDLILPRIDQGVGSTSGIRACALRNFDLGTMELENSQNNALAKLPMLKLGEYEMWEIRIKQYFQIQDYALWEVIENGNSWVPIPVTAPESGPSTALKMIVPSTTEEKICKKNDVKARSLLLMALPNEHQLTFNQYVDAQSMFAAIKARFGGNEATKRTQKALLIIITPPEDLNVKFLRSLPSEWDTIVGSQLVHEDLEQLHDDDLEEIDLKWNMALLSMRARKFYQRTGRKIIIDESSTAGYDKSKVECFNCLKMGHFFRRCRAKGVKTTEWNQGSSSKAVRIEDASKKAMCAIDGAGFDWSDMAEEEIQANMALMAFSDSEVTNDKSCSKSCLKNYEALKKQYDDLLVKLDDTGFKASTYKRGHRISNGLLRLELEKVKEEKEGFEFKIAKFEKSSKDLDDLLASQITDKSKKGFGYNAVPSPHPLILNRPTPLDLSYSGLEEFKQPEVNEYGPRDSSVKPTTGCDKESDNSKENTDDSLKQQQKTDSSSVKEEEPKKARENNDAPIIEDWVSDDEDDVEPIPKVEKKTVIPTATKKEFVKPETPVRRSVSCPNAYKHMVPRAVLMKTGLKTVNNAKPVNTVRSVNTARPFSTARGIKPAIGFMKPFGCHVTILNTLDKLGKFDGKSDEGIQGVSESSTSSQQDQDCIVMPIWKDASYFDDTSLKSVDDAQIQDQVGTHDDCSIQDNGTDDQQVNTASPEVNTGSREVSTAVPEVNTATPEDLMGPIPTSEDTQVE
ncbi:ribonuclease H-like domain-containing protein, partial [Tanacetum coccineum]